MPTCVAPPPQSTIIYNRRQRVRYPCASNYGRTHFGDHRNRYEKNWVFIKIDRFKLNFTFIINILIKNSLFFYFKYICLFVFQLKKMYLLKSVCMVRGLLSKISSYILFHNDVTIVHICFM